MSDCNTNGTAGARISKDCDDCQKTLKDHLKECADYGKLPTIVEKCEDLPGGCSVGKPETCPAPPPPCPPKPCPPPPACVVPTTTFTCPASDCPAPKCDEPPKKTSVCDQPSSDNSCEVKPLFYDKKC